MKKYCLTIQNNPYREVTDYSNPLTNYKLKRPEGELEVRSRERPVEKYLGYYYHSTPCKNVESIARKGLLPGKKEMWRKSEEAIYVSTHPAGAIQWFVRGVVYAQVEEAYDPEGSVYFALLRIPTATYAGEWKYDTLGTRESGPGESWYIKKRIPPEVIEIRTLEQWVPIKTVLIK